MWVCVCVAEGPGDVRGWEKQSSTENIMCKDPGTGNSHPQKCRVYFYFIYSSIYPADIFIEYLL